MRDLTRRFVTYEDADPEQERAFADYATGVGSGWAQLLLTLIIVAHVVFGPTDHLIYDEPLLTAMRQTRLGSGVVPALAVLLLRLDLFGPRGVVPITAGCMVMVCAWTGHQFGTAGGIDQPLFYVLWAALPMTVVIFTRLPARVVITGAVALAWTGGFFALHPANLEAPYLVGALLFTLFVVLFTTVAGHGVYHLLRVNWYQRAALDAERARSERLLLNVLPASIASRLKNEERPIAEGYESVSVLFADMVGFTRWAEEVDPSVMVRMLDHLFSAFDLLVERHGLEKIKTIGDAYMVASGLPTRREDHAVAMAHLGLDMLDAVANAGEDGPPLQLRIGIHSGPAVGGVIGFRKFIYDLWGDTVNLASRMESHGVPGAIQVTEATKSLIEHAFVLEPRGMVEVKGKGPTPTWFLRSRRDDEPA